MKAAVARPRIYYELARLRYAQARLIPAGAKGLLSAGQVATVLDVLERGRRLHPALPESYQLACEVWLHTAEKATPAQLGMLEEGVRLFPWNLPLIFEATGIDLRQGRAAEASAMVAHGLEVTAEGPARDRLLLLQGQLLQRTAAAP